MKTCPHCAAKAITSWQLVRSALGLGYAHQCGECSTSFAIAKRWKWLFTFSGVFAFIVATAMSAIDRNYDAYIFIPLALLACSMITVCLATPKAKATPKPRSNSAKVLIGLVILLGVVVIYRNTFA